MKQSLRVQPHTQDAFLHAGQRVLTLKVNGREGWKKQMLAYKVKKTTQNWPGLLEQACSKCPKPTIN